MSRSAHILLVGCGQLGSRHLQAVASLPQVASIDVVDPRSEALRLGQQRLQELPDLQAHIQFRWLTSVEPARPGGDLCLIATQAEGRRLLVEQCAARGYRRFLVEKIVTQSVDEYERLLAFAAEQRLSVWVNCQERTYPIHQYIHSRLAPGEPLILSVVGGNHGLACNGIHEADLFAYFTAASAISGSGTTVDPRLHPSKRGPQIFDLSGVLRGATADGDQLVIAFAGDHAAPYHILVQNRRRRWMVDYISGAAWEGRPETDWRWEPIGFEAEMRVSYTTRWFAAAILAGETCPLPTLAEAFVAHQFILTELLPHFNRLRQVQSDECPVT